ncbi:helix-turn-helix transcriptional regulator [Fusibacter sp. JL216-2]|uniref:helix-turn-helix transcriptional regulator n=1 Tax=Fusibacter sp. JL216-2 TaxID=3071453 RepID=UPI003D3363C5
MMQNFSRQLEKLDRFETEHLRLLYYDLPSQFTDTYKSYEYVRLCTVIEGEKQVKINDGREFVYGKDQFVLLPAHSHVDMHMKTSTKALVLEMSGALIDKVGDKVQMDIDTNLTNFKLCNKTFLGENKSALKFDIDKIVRTYFSREINKSFLIDLYAQEMVYELLKMKGAYHILHSDKNHPIAIAIAYIQENINNPITVKELSWVVNMSESNFSRQFKNVTGSSPTEYIRNFKLARARDMLKSKNVTEVCYELGYENVSYFIRLFKNKYGWTPKQYAMMTELMGEPLL